MVIPWDIIIKLLISALIGGIVGAEREYHNKSAGLRTLMLICLGSTLFTLVSQELGAHASPDRIASNIVTGVGFVGAGVIFMSGTGINGVTTAATIWITAALGMSVGADHEYFALICCVALTVVLRAFTLIEEWIGKINCVHTYKITCIYHEKVLEQHEALLKQNKLIIKRGTQCRDKNVISTTWEAEGSKKNHKGFINHMLNDKEVDRFEFDGSPL